MARTERKSIQQQRLEWDQELKSLSESIDKLRVQYDRYFMGIDRIPPIRDREKLEKAFLRTRLRDAKNTAIRFKFQNLQARWVTYRQHWNRVMRLIEEGKFRRDKSVVPPGAAALPPVVEAPPADPMRELYDQWAQARSSVGLKEVAFDKFAAKMAATKSKHIKQLGAKDVRYSVKIKDGKVALTAKAIKG